MIWIVNADFGSKPCGKTKLKDSYSSLSEKENDVNLMGGRRVYFDNQISPFEIYDSFPKEENKGILLRFLSTYQKLFNFSNQSPLVEPILVNLILFICILFLTTKF